MSQAPTSTPELTLPPVQTAMLDASTLERLFEDLARDATEVQVQVRTVAGARREPGAPSLTQARELLEQGVVQGMQIRYRAAGARWCDTLLRKADGMWLVRIEQP